MISEPDIRASYRAARLAGPRFSRDAGGEGYENKSGQRCCCPAAPGASATAITRYSPARAHFSFPSSVGQPCLT